jgi:hypothetical protein
METFDLHPRVVVGKAKSDEPFILARQRPERMVDNLAGRTHLAIWGGALLALLSVALLLKGLNLW